MSNMVVANNIMALNSHRNLKAVGTKQEVASARLSSGYRINSAADDAAGLAISEKMRAQIRGLNMASKNAQDAISLIQTAEGGMQEIDNMIQRIRELVVYASNDTQEHNIAGTGDRQKIQDEIDQLVSEIDSMAERVEFNKKKVINGSCEAVPTTSSVITSLATAKTALKAAQLTYNSAETTYDTSLKGVSSARNGFDTLIADPDAVSRLTALSTANAGAYTSEVSDVNAAISDLKAAFATAGSEADITTIIGSELLALTSAVTALGTTISGSTPDASDTAAFGYINGLLGVSGGVSTMLTGVETAYTTSEAAASDLAIESGDLATAKADVAVAQAAFDGSPKTPGLYFQVGANANQSLELSIASVKTDKLGIGDGHGVVDSAIKVIDVSGRDITAALDTLDTALSYVTTERSKLGAAQNRLQYTINSLDISAENLTSAESRIRDTDMAKEMMNLTQANILQQAAVAMLAQANQAPQSILQLLQ